MSRVIVGAATISVRSLAAVKPRPVAAMTAQKKRKPMAFARRPATRHKNDSIAAAIASHIAGSAERPK